MIPANCDCGACCNQCGHEPGCSVYEPRPDLDAAIANPRPGSFLDWMLQGEKRGDAA